jgi:CRP-like cAMP-binding protein
MSTFQSLPINRLLAALPADEYARIAPHLTAAPLRARGLLHKRDEPLKQIIFPGRALCSLVVTMEEGASAEVAVVGAEGLIGVEAALGQRVASCDATVQVAGDGQAFVMSIDAFRAELANSAAFESVIRNYARAFVGFVMQSVACNGLHSIDERCCRWLLHAQDRLEANDLRLTHDLISTMLGVRRPTVTLVMNSLAQAGIVSASRGTVRILDRAMLESRACTCYGTIAADYIRHLSAAAAQPLCHPDGKNPMLAGSAKSGARVSVS